MLTPHNIGLDVSGAPRFHETFLIFADMGYGATATLTPGEHFWRRVCPAGRFFSGFTPAAGVSVGSPI